MRQAPWRFVLCWFCALPSPLSASDPFRPEEAVQAALLASPDIARARAEVEVAEGARAQAFPVLDNPRVEGAGDLDGGRVEGAVSVPLDLAGVRLAERRAGVASADASRLLLERTEREVAAQVRGAYADAVVAGRDVVLARAGHDVAARLADAARARFDQGEVSALDLKLARLALAGAGARLLEAQQAQGEALSRLAVLTGRSVDPASLDTDPLAVSPAPSDGNPGERADLHAARDQVRAAEAALGARRREMAPQVEVGWQFEQEADLGHGPAFSADLPLFQRNQEERARARGQLDVERARLASLQAQVETEQAQALARDQQAHLLLPDAQALADGVSALAAVEGAWNAGEMDLPTALLLQAQVLEGQSSANALLGQVAHARLDLLLALDDPALLPRGDR